MHYHCQVTSLQVVMPPPHQRAPEMRSPNHIGEVKVAEAEVLSVVAPAGPTVAVALAIPSAHSPAFPPPPLLPMMVGMKLQKALGTKQMLLKEE